jgi:hypothetical protein
MGTVTLRLPDDKHDRLRFLAKQRKMSINKLIDELATIAIIQSDYETSFKAQAAKGDPNKGLAIIDKLDKIFASEI